MTATRNSVFVFAALSVGCASESDPDPVASDVDAFVASLPAWVEVSPPVVEAEGPLDDAVPVEVELEGQRCTQTSYAVADNPREIALASPDASVLWPGALLQGGSHLAIGSLEPLVVRQDRRAPLGLSVQGGGLLGVSGGVSTVVDEPTGSTVREGINSLIANAIDDEVVVGAGTSSFESVTSHSDRQSLLSLGLDARYLAADLEASFRRERGLTENSVTATFVQRLFTVSVDLPESPSAMFADDMTGADLEMLGVSEDNLPLYVDSVSYGRRLMVKITSSQRAE
ncbi:MAG: thiol-activated cytolysin family protein, partial [Myxococcota bacterium]